MSARLTPRKPAGKLDNFGGFNVSILTSGRRPHVHQTNCTSRQRFATVRAGGHFELVCRASHP